MLKDEDRMAAGLGRLLVDLGLLLVVAGGLLWLSARFLPLGRLPLDLKIERGRLTFFFPLGTALLLSLLLTLVLNLLLRLRR
jgi:hypothetical protein